MLLRHFTSTLEALLKCAPVFFLQLLGVYPLMASGQGKETVRAMVDPSVANISWLCFLPVLFWGAILSSLFLFFLLSEWNYPAKDAWRAFLRVWLPATLTQATALLLPLVAEFSERGSRVFDVMMGFMGLIIPVLLIAAWWKTKPAPRPAVVVFFLIGSAVVAIIAFFVSIRIFYAISFVVTLGFCILTCRDFQDAPNWPWRWLHYEGILFAVLYVGILILVYTRKTPLPLLLGAPTVLVSGLSFFTAVAFLFTYVLSLASAALVRAGWALVLVGILIFSRLNDEPIRLLPASQGTVLAQAPAEHFRAWLDARPEAKAASTNYPVFFIATEGGGIRAAYWTATLLAGLEERYPGFTRHVYAISAVSGGSVGAAVFDAMYLDLSPGGFKRCAPLVPGGLESLRACVASALSGDLLSLPLSRLLMHDFFLGWHRPSRGEALEQGLEYSWIMATNSNRFESSFLDLWKDRPYDIPSLILNTTSADSGGRFVVSNLRAEGQLTQEPGVLEIAGRPIRLSTAALLSARFPYISPDAILDSPVGDRYRFVDGGYFNNSGTASLGALLHAVLPILKSCENCSRITPMVIVIRSAPDQAESHPKGSPRSLTGTLLEPLFVLNSASSVHEAAYLKEVRAAMTNDQSILTFRPPAGTERVALGWMLSSETRCKMDNMVNSALNNSSMIAGLMRAQSPSQAKWTSCAPSSEASP